jgi:predicted transport protein
MSRGFFMAIFAIHAEKLKHVIEKPFKLEREIQALFESNLKQVMGLTLVRSEFSIKNKRIDTLAFDEQTSAFIIIEYKRDKNISVVDQGFTYLSLMLENKADFIVEYNEQLKRNLKRDDVDWSQTRVAFVSPSFTDNQIQATNFKDIAIELWEVKRFDNNTLLVTELKKSRSAESIKPITQQNKDLKRIADEITVYTEDALIARASAEMAELYDKFRSSILNLADDIEIVPVKSYVAFKKSSNVVDIEIQKKSLKIFINAKWGKINDSKGIARDVSQIGHSGNGDYQIQVTDDKDLEYIMSLVKQVLSESN